MTNTVIERMKQRKNFYRDNYRRMVKALLFCLFLIMVLIVLLMIIKITETERGFYATSNIGGLTKIYPATWGARIKQPPQT